MRGKGHAGFLIFFTFLLVIFLREIIFMKGAFLHGDYRAQFYPWACIYADAIKHMQLPFWSSAFGCGFPLMAEGQIGGFYPLTALFYYLLPLNFAYNYLTVFHFILGGLFMYAYSRMMGADQWGGALASLIFCFGSGYAGCFYNTAAVRTMVWFPLALLFIERYFSGRNVWNLAASGIIAGLQLLAGFVQMAVFSVLFYMFYCLLRLFFDPERRPVEVLLPVYIVIPAAVIFAPQFILSWELVGLSGRASATLESALWGSFAPTGFMGSFFPRWMISHGRMYIGILSIIFLVYAVIGFKRDRRVALLSVLAVLAALLAFGTFNLLYVGVLKLTKLYSFRNPYKFLFFTTTFVAVLTGMGFTCFFKDNDVRRRKAAAGFTACLLFAASAIFIALKFAIVRFKGIIISCGEWYVKKFVFGRPFHRYSPDSYIERVNGVYRDLVATSSFTDGHNIAAGIFIIITLCACLYFIKSRPAGRLKAVSICVIALDLYLFVPLGTGFKGNIESFDSLKPECPKMLKAVQAADGLFRIIPFDLRSGRLPLWAVPSANALYGIDSIAVYTPLAISRYKEKLSGLEVVDDSLGLESPSDEALKDYRNKLRLLNVRYIVSPRRLAAEFLREVMSEDGIFLYELSAYNPRIFFADDIGRAADVSGGARVDQVEYSDGRAKAAVDSKIDGYLVFSESVYPGWEAYIDGKPAKILPVEGLVQAVSIEAGRHEIIFRYETPLMRYFRIGRVVHRN